jgi:hypothetical protein
MELGAQAGIKEQIRGAQKDASALRYLVSRGASARNSEMHDSLTDLGSSSGCVAASACPDSTSRLGPAALVGEQEVCPEPGAGLWCLLPVRRASRPLSMRVVWAPSRVSSRIVSTR